MAEMIETAAEDPGCFMHKGVAHRSGDPNAGRFCGCCSQLPRVPGFQEGYDKSVCELSGECQAFYDATLETELADLLNDERRG